MIGPVLSRLDRIGDFELLSTFLLGLCFYVQLNKCSIGSLIFLWKAFAYTRALPTEKAEAWPSCSFQQKPLRPSEYILTGTVGVKSCILMKSGPYSSMLLTKRR